MENATIFLKIKQRLNKLASNDYDNIECWQVVEAFNKGMTQWCRRNLHGSNSMKEGDEQSKRRIDDLQVLLGTKTMIMNDRKLFYQSEDLPDNYFEWKRLEVEVSNECCPGTRRMTTYLAEEANVELLLRDKNKQPNFEWAETFCTMLNNQIRVYSNEKFEVKNTTLYFYRQPVYIQIEGCVDPYTQQVSTQNVNCEFKDDVIEVFIDEAVKIIAGDIESMTQYQRAQQSVEGNN